MKQRSKKLLGILLSLALVLSLLPAMALTASAVSYTIFVGGTGYSGNADGDGWKYTSSNHTLTLNGYTYNGAGAGIRYTGSETLKIKLKGTNTITSTGSDSYGIYSENGALEFSDTGSLLLNANTAIYGTGDITIRSGVVTATGTVDSGIKGNNITIVNGEVTAEGIFYGIFSNNQVTIEDGIVEAKATGNDSYGILAYDNHDVMINGGIITAIGNTRGIFGNVKNAIAGTGWTNTTGTEGEAPIAVNTDHGQTLDSYKMLHFHSYPLWVDNTRVTVGNKDDVLGDGTVKFTPATTGEKATPATLTLNGANITQECVVTGDGGHSYIFYNGSDPLTISLVGDNKVNENAGSSCGIKSNNIAADITISGEGSLTVSSGNTNAIYCKHDVIIDSGTVIASGNSAIYANNGVKINDGTVTATSVGSNSNGIECSNGDITISGGTVTATGTQSAIFSYFGDITISGGTVVANSEASAIYVYNGGVLISDNSNVVATGRSGISAESNVTITGGTVKATSTTNGDNGIYSNGNITISGSNSKVDATGRANGIKSHNGDITISGGTVNAVGTGNFGSGINTSGNITISSDIVSLTAKGGSEALYGTVKNTVAGAGWTNVEGTGDGTSIEVSAGGQTLTYKKVQFPSSATTFTVTYDANGGTGTLTDSTKYKAGDSVPVLSSAFTAPAGKKFDKWNTAKNGTGTSCKPGDSYTITADITFYAQWIDAEGESTDIDGITKTFDLNTGSEDHKDVEIPLEDMDVYSVSGDVEITADDYTVENDTLTFKKDYLSKLAVGDHKFTVSGYVVGTDTEAELAVTIKVVDTTPSATPDYYYTETVYKVILAETENGKATASRSTAPKGATVTVTGTPDEGYVLDAITAKDAKGNDVTVTDGKFTMPASDVTVTVTFKAAESEPGFATCDHGDGCILNDFSDLDPDAWYHDGVHYVLETGLMEGYGDGTFRPNDFASRAMAITLIWNMEGKPVVNFALPYSDVAQGKWYTEAIRWATSEGIVEGWTDEATGKKVFAPDADVTREQFAAMLYRYAQLHGEGFTGMWMFRLDFPDAADVSDWADEAMHWMVMQGVINGMDGKLNPQGKATRAMLATMVQRFVLGA